MRWSIIRVIWLREMRDQLRDRRTAFMVVVLPLLLYPILGFGVLQFTLGYAQQTSTVGIYGVEHLPPEATSGPPSTAVRVAAWVAASAGPGGPDLVVGAAARDHIEGLVRGRGFPALLTSHDGTARFVPHY